MLLSSDRDKHVLISARTCVLKVLVATPGRLLSLCGQLPASSRARGGEMHPSEASVLLHNLTLIVLDEADRLLDLGFEEDIKQIMVLSQGDQASKPWVLMFSATWGSQIQSLADIALSRRAVRINIGSDEPTAAITIQQRVEVMRGKGAPRLRRLCALLREYLSSSADVDSREVDADESDAEEEEEEEGQEGQAGLSEDDDACELDANHGDECQREDTSALESGEAGQDGKLDEENPADATSPDSVRGLEADARIVVFAVYKKEAKDVARLLCERGFRAVALQGDMSQVG